VNIYIYICVREIRDKNLGALGTTDESLANILDLEHGRGLDIVPILLGEGIGAVD